ncbi:hypothetical protein F442_15063 [Phytophthora nicotianae P10297]|uniref:Uncharacterized protein n=1 Tax=Phytophthora nicotianae P10297 TaxID=1317064 RepID=W2YR32_PHYNI|nr:hypothetical protein F442_15063 [Phytophthora nicotianae P10297]
MLAIRLQPEFLGSSVRCSISCTTRCGLVCTRRSAKTLTWPRSWDPLLSAVCRVTTRLLRA